jgi:hypothetical protein
MQQVGPLEFKNMLSGTLQVIASRITALVLFEASKWQLCARFLVQKFPFLK